MLARDGFKGGHVTQAGQGVEVCSGVGFWEMFSLLFKKVAQEEMMPSFSVWGGCCQHVTTIAAGTRVVSLES